MPRKQTITHHECEKSKKYKRSDIDKIAKTYNIDYKKYKNRKLLCEAILLEIKSSSKRTKKSSSKRTKKSSSKRTKKTSSKKTRKSSSKKTRKSSSKRTRKSSSKRTKKSSSKRTKKSSSKITKKTSSKRTRKASSKRTRKSSINETLIRKILKKEFKIFKTFNEAEKLYPTVNSIRRYVRGFLKEKYGFTDENIHEYSYFIKREIEKRVGKLPIE